METIVLDIQRSARHDGPGLRTAVFLKGCPLRCAWCHNPESWSGGIQLMYNAERCTGCGRCARVCPQGVHGTESGVHSVSFSDCTACGACAKACPSGALTLSGKKRSVQEVFEIVERDRVFYETTGGGLTLSGGEPLIHPDFCEKLLGLCRREGIHTCVETSGQVPEETMARLLPLIDLFLFDYKVTGEENARKWIGADGRLICRNLEHLLAAGKKVVLRCPLIPGVNDTQEHLREIGRLAGENDGILRAELLPYHRFGVVKGRNIGKESPEFQVPDEERKGIWMETVRKVSQGKVIWG